eukprot:scaffold129858_cov27-Tisochrysis_lutea.AAC.5
MGWVGHDTFFRTWGSSCGKGGRTCGAKRHAPECWWHPRHVATRTPGCACHRGWSGVSAGEAGFWRLSCQQDHRVPR